MTNKINTNKRWKSLLYNAILDYCRDYFNLSNNIIIDLKLNNSKLKTKSFGDINLGTKNIINVEDTDINVTISYIIHEFTHIKQKLKKELRVEKSMLLWKNTPIISIKDYNKISYNQHKNLPWEIEANFNMNLIQKFYRSKYFQNLKGKDPNLDIIVLGINI